MTAAEVTEALNRYESALRRLGAPVISQLGPGVSDAEIAELEMRYGAELPDEVRAVWRWHDGTAGARTANGGDPKRALVPHGVFGDLAWSLEFAHEFMTITTDANPASEYAGRTFVSLLIDNVGFVINLTAGEPPLTYLNDPMSWTMSDYSVMPVAERIQWWTTALETRAWTVSPNGEWVVDFDRYPQDQHRNAFL